MICAGARVIGLTGGIATGKSSVANFFREKGVTVIDADQLSRDAVAQGAPVLHHIVELLGDSACNQDGTLNRQYVREQIFADATKRKQLEALLHPEIKRLSMERIQAALNAGEKIVVYMAPLLIEADACDRVDDVWVVSVHPEVQLERLMLRDNLSVEQAQAVIDSQMPLAEKERYADVVIYNNGTLQETGEQFEKLWSRESGYNHE